MSECDLHDCEGCENYSGEDATTLWPCLFSHCPHHPEVECQFEELLE